MFSKKVVTAIAVVFSMLVSGGCAVRDKIAERAMETLIEKNMGRNIVNELPDGLHVLLCGSGSPMPDLTRAGPCTAVIAGKRAFIFDTGAGSVRKLSRMRFPVGATEAIYLTHLHSDHFDGLGETMLNRWIAGSRKEPTPIYGPVGTTKVANGFNDAYRIDSGYRHAHHGDEVADLRGYGLAPKELDFNGDSKVVLDEGDLRITVFRVNHKPIDPAFGYRVDYKGRSVTISGDTTYHKNLVKVAKGSDLLLHEALNMEMVQTMEKAAEKRGMSSVEKIFFDIQDYHTSPVDAARAARESGSRALVLTHIVPILPSRILHGLFTKGMDDEYDGPITVGTDGLLFSLPAGSDEIEKSSLL